MSSLNTPEQEAANKLMAEAITAVNLAFYAEETRDTQGMVLYGYVVVAKFNLFDSESGEAFMAYMRHTEDTWVHDRIGMHHYALVREQAQMLEGDED